MSSRDDQASKGALRRVLVPGMSWERAQQGTTEQLALCVSAKESGLKMFDTRDGDNDEGGEERICGVKIAIGGEKGARIRRKTETTNSYLRYRALFSGNGGKVLGDVEERRERSVLGIMNRPVEAQCSLLKSK